MTFFPRPARFNAKVLTLALATAIVGWQLIQVVPSDGQAVQPMWQGQWGTEDGFAIDIDTEGYAFPVAIAFVPDPGPDPKDPLYFVTELRGTIKVVSNDRTVTVFAQDFFHLTPAAELPDQRGELGLAGICLSPEYGYVFATFSYQDEAGVLRNNIVRFTSTPGRFSVATAQVTFTDIFAAAESSSSHQIGGGAR